MLALLLAPFTLTITTPSPALAPSAVVTAQLEALQSGDVSTCFQFASPNNRKATGPWQKFEMMVRQTPAYSPLVSCSSFEILSALSLSETTWQARVMVRPAGSSSAPFAIANPICYYVWQLSQQGDDEGEFSGCWMVDGVLPDTGTVE